MDDQGVNPDASFCKKIEKGIHYHHSKAVGPKANNGKFGPFGMLNGTPKVPNWPLDTEHSFVFVCHLDPSSRVFFTGPCTQTCFHPPSMIFHLFSGYFRLFKNNYLVDKYPKINLDKVQIIHILLLSNHPFYSYACNPILNTNYHPITELFN